MGARRSRLADIRTAGLVSGVAAIGGLWMVVVALCGDDGFFRPLSPPAAIAPPPDVALAPSAMDYASDPPTIAATIRSLHGDRRVPKQHKARFSGKGHDRTGSALRLAKGDPRQQLMDAADLLQRREASPDRPPVLLVPSTPPPRRSGDQ